MKIKLSISCLALACFILGCDKKPAEPQTVAQPTPSTQPVTQPVAQTSATPPSAPEVAVQKPAQPAEVIDLGSLMNRIPTNEFALSDDGDWDKFTMPKVQKWVNDNLVGKRSSVHACVLQCNVNQEDANSKPDEWTVSLKITGIHATYAGLPNRILPIDKDDQTDHSPEIGIWGKADFTFKCNETEARKWDAFSKKMVPAVTVVGDVVGIDFQPHLGGDFNDFFVGYDTFVKLDNVVLTTSDDTEPGAFFLPEYAMALHGMPREPDEEITEMKRLDTNGDYQLVLMKYYEKSKKDTETRLLSFSLVAESINDFLDKSLKITPCDNPPTDSQIAQAKDATGWPKN
jgi:hypothetical protein